MRETTCIKIVLFRADEIYHLWQLHVEPASKTLTRVYAAACRSRGWGGLRRCEDIPTTAVYCCIPGMYMYVYTPHQQAQ